MTNKEIENDRIQSPFKPKNWNEIRINDSWALFKIMNEFVTGYETMSRIGPCVSIFGSARTPKDHPYYKMAEEAAYLLTKIGFGVITGGGPAIMEAANKGAQKGGGEHLRAQPHGCGARARARRHPLPRVRRECRREPRRRRRALSRRDGDFDRRYAHTH